MYGYIKFVSCRHPPSGRLGGSACLPPTPAHTSVHTTASTRTQRRSRLGKMELMLQLHSRLIRHQSKLTLLASRTCCLFLYAMCGACPCTMSVKGDTLCLSEPHMKFGLTSAVSTVQAICDRHGGTACLKIMPAHTHAPHSHKRTYTGKIGFATCQVRCPFCWGTSKKQHLVILITNRFWP